MSRAALGSAAFVIAGPAVELGLGPWVLTGLEVGDGLPGAWPLRALGAVLLAAALVVYATAMVAFARAGGTPSPALPPAEPVLAGVYARLRHPMYAAASTGLVGEALLLRAPVLLLAAALYAATMAALVRWVEEPLLRRRFGAGWRSSR